MIGACLCQFYLNMKVGWVFVCSELGEEKTGYSGEGCFCLMYVEWCRFCNFIVISAAEVCVYYVCVCVFHVYGVGICIDICVVVVC